MDISFFLTNEDGEVTAPDMNPIKSAKLLPRVGERFYTKKLVPEHEWARHHKDIPDVIIVWDVDWNYDDEPFIAVYLCDGRDYKRLRARVEVGEHI